MGLKATLFGGLAVGLTVAVIAANRPLTPEQAEQKAVADCEDSRMAFVMAKGFVRDRLKAPTTAKFPTSYADGVATKHLGECRHRVVAYVDAHNGFGAQIRTPYVVEVRQVYGTDKWILESLSM